jgi:hypothetical protein
VNCLDTFHKDDRKENLNLLSEDLDLLWQTVKYFSQGKERIFPRTKTVIGRNVRDCHPPCQRSYRREKPGEKIMRISGSKWGCAMSIIAILPSATKKETIWEPWRLPRISGRFRKSPGKKGCWRRLHWMGRKRF